MTSNSSNKDADESQLSHEEELAKGEVVEEEVVEGARVRRKGIYLLPNLLTTASLFSGFFAMVSAANGMFEKAAIAIFVSMILDGLDGRVARMTNTALRLARFNTQIGSVDKKYFVGLPSPAAAAVVAGLVWCFSGFEREGWLTLMTVLVVAGTGVLMVSNVLYRSFKDLDLRGKVPFAAILVVVLVFVVIALDPGTVLFAGFLAYATSGPLRALFRKMRAPKEAEKA